MRILIVLLCCQALLACAVFDTSTRRSTLNDTMQSWINSIETELISDWGVPDKSYTLNNGDKIVSYLSFVHPGRYCEQKFLIQRGILTKWGHSNCDLYFSNSKDISKTIPIPKPTL